MGGVVKRSGVNKPPESNSLNQPRVNQSTMYDRAWDRVMQSHHEMCGNRVPNMSLFDERWTRVITKHENMVAARTTKNYNKTNNETKCVKISTATDTAHFEDGDANNEREQAQAIKPNTRSEHKKRMKSGDHGLNNSEKPYFALYTIQEEEEEDVDAGGERMISSALTLNQVHQQGFERSKQQL